MRIATFITIASLTVSTTPTFAQSVTYDFDKGTDFSRLKTYTWIRGTILNDELNHKRIVDAVDAQLVSKRMREVLGT
jgi:hypothetical protein